MVDARYEITQQEEQKILSTVFASMQPLRLKTFPPKEKKKVVILRTIAKEFEEGIRYSEVQVNEILKDIYGLCHSAPVSDRVRIPGAYP